MPASDTKRAWDDLAKPTLCEVLFGAAAGPSVELALGVLLRLADDDITKAAEMVECEETLGPILDPTTYIRGGADKLAQARGIVAAVRAARAALEAIRPCRHPTWVVVIDIKGSYHYTEACQACGMRRERRR